MTKAIELVSASKSYAGKEVLKELDFSLEQGTVMGLVGKNGSGKTTLLNAAMGLVRLKNGSSTVYGEDSWQLGSEIKHRIGFVPQQYDFCGWMYVGHLLDFVGSFYQRWDKAKVSALCKEWELEMKVKVSALSVGQRQRLSIILALGHNPDLLVLDEPVASLDPIARREFLKTIINLSMEDGKTVIFSTHITSDIERVAADIALLQEGHISYQGNLDELKNDVVRLRIQSKQALPEYLPLENVVSSQVEGTAALATITNANSLDVNRLRQILNADVSIEHLNLEDIFVALETNQAA